jgi:CHASE2 domain-containing sensor protein
MDTDTLTNIAFAGVAIFGAVLAIMAILAARRVRSPRMVMVAVGFLLIAAQGVVVGVSLFAGGADLSFLLLVSALFEAAVLVVLFLATLLR